MHHPPTTRREVSKDFPCLICGKDHGCTEFPDGNFICRRIENPDRRDLKGGGWWWPDPRDKDAEAPPQVNVITTPEAPRASIEWLHAVYSALLAGLSLSPVHRSHLAGDGWASHEIEAAFQSGFFRTLPDSKDLRRRQVLKDLYARFGGTLAEVPGFSLLENDRGRKWASLRAGAGILFPILNQHQQVVGLRLRRDETKDGQSRYHWLSSKKTGGPTSGTPAAYYGPANARTRFLTEGEKKAAFSLSRRPGFREDELFAAISVPGHATYGELLADLTKDHCDRIVIALDEESDPKKAAMVDASRQAIAQHAARQGIVVEVLRWDSLHKGIDDVIVAGGKLVRSAWCPEPPEDPTESTTPESLPATKRKWIKLRQTPAASRPAPPTAGEARLQLREMMRSVGTAARRHDLKLFIAKVAPGVGKSTIADEIFRAASGLTSVYLVGNTANIPTDAEERYLGKARILPTGHTCCSSYAAIETQLNKGVPHDHLCFDPECTYRNQQRIPDPDRLTYTAYQTAQHIRAFRESDLTIVDDIAPYQLGFTIGTANLVDLEDWRRFIDTPAGKPYEGCKDLVNVLREVLRDNEKTVGNSDFGVDYIRGRFNKFAEMQGFKFRDALSRARKDLSGDKGAKGLGEPIRQRHLAGSEPRIFLRELVGIIAQAMKGGAGERRLLISEAGEWKWYRDLRYGQRRKRRKPGWNQSLDAGPKTILWLDADADVDAIKALFPDHGEPEIIDLSVLALPEEVQIVQDVSQRWGKVAQETGPSRSRLVEMVQDDLTEAMGRGCELRQVGIIGHKAFVDAVEVADEVKRANYYGLRSNNSIESVRELFVYGTPQVGSQAMMELCRAFWGEDVRSDKVNRPRVYQGKAFDFTADNVEGWADERLRAMDEYFSVQELRQAVDRARPLNASSERPVRITYCGQHPLPYLVDEFVGLATARTETKQSLLTQIVEALSTGQVQPDAGRRTIAEFLGSSERKVRDAISEFTLEVEAAREAGRRRESVAVVMESALRTRPKVTSQIVAVTILDTPTITTAPRPTPPPAIEPRPAPLPESTPATSPLLAS